MTMTLTTTMTSQQSRNLIKLPPVCESFFTYPQSQAIPLTRPVICSPQRNRSVFAFKLNFFRLICRPDLFVFFCHSTNHSSEADPLISPVGSLFSAQWLNQEDEIYTNYSIQSVVLLLLFGHQQHSSWISIKTTAPTEEDCKQPPPWPIDECATWRVNPDLNHWSICICFVGGGSLIKSGPELSWPFCHSVPTSYPHLSSSFCGHDSLGWPETHLIINLYNQKVTHRERQMEISDQ